MNNEIRRQERKALFNRTTGGYVKDDEGKVCEFDNVADAERALEQVNDLKQVNPEHRDDEIVIVRG